MKNILGFLTFLSLTIIVVMHVANPQAAISTEMIPNDYLWVQRAFPYQNIPSKTYYNAVSMATKQTANRGSNALNWILAGPTNVGGRITDVAMHASDQQIIYAATASGGVWKSLDAGAQWSPISDDLPSLSIGDIAIDPANKNTIYCGTGETNGGGGSVTYDGLGLFKSNDAGISWQAIGLENTGSIGRIEVDPGDPNRIYVAAMGHLFGNNPDRGVYRSVDGGLSWSQSLFVNDSVGAIDMVIHPLHPDTIFAVTWERIRRPEKRMYGGPGSAVWRSTNGGDNWEKLAGGLPVGSNNGRMGIAISASNPNILYVTVARANGTFAGVYRSEDNGDNWQLVPQNGDPGYSSYGWWFGQIRVHPGNPDHIFNLGVGWKESTDAGGFWSEVSNYLHADYHALYIHPANPDFRVVGNDGGIYISSNGGANWQHRPLPITQFYTSEIDFQEPTLFSGGTQDNGTQSSVDGDLDNWVHIFGGDGFVTLVNPLDNSIFYAESQYGGLGGSNGASAPSAARYNWNCPYIFDPNDPAIMYFGAERLFKSYDGGLQWNAFSQDLSNGVTGTGGIVYGTITTIAASALDSNVVIVGTDDGNVWITPDGGNNWNKVSDNLPKRWVTKVVTDLWDAQTAYVCLSGFRHNEAMVHVYKTEDLGQTWTAVSGDLPDVPVNDLILDPFDPDVWYLATDVGMFTTIDGGAHWMPDNSGMPIVPILDLTFHTPTRTLVAATYGRSMYSTVVAVPSRVQEQLAVGQLRISPNPFVSDIQLELQLFEQENLQIDLFDLSGKSVANMQASALTAGAQKLVLHTTGLNAGVYVLSIKAKGKKPVCRKLIKL